MKKVFLVHGFEGSPNGGWRPWLMSELDKSDVYCCSLSMPNPEKPEPSAWVDEISGHVSKNDEVSLVGHSLGVPAILKFLEQYKIGKKLVNIVLVSGPLQKTDNKLVNKFLSKPFDFEKIKSKAKNFFVIHGDNDPLVPVSDAIQLSKLLDAKLTFIKNGKHLNGSSGWHKLPACLKILENNL